MEQLNRLRERGRTGLGDLYALLDEVPYAVLATVGDGRPWQVPLLHARDGDRVLLHGSTGAGALRALDAGAPVSLCVTAFDGLVVAHSTFDSSANYRSAVIWGHAIRLTGDDQAAALDLLSDRLLPGRTKEVRASRPKEWAATLVLAVPIVEGSWLMKARSGGPSAADEEHDVWTGLVPASLSFGTPEPTPDSVDRPIPASVRALTAD
ncbi:MAG: pyridoxamine 5'-phosphate oxidase family protein [Nocardioides sp.]|jgi:nitroimidazol reductase NimA-like FMN-containing flavoprotein (pyridoxamine 5'-phosphate oxidase superfamily)